MTLLQALLCGLFYYLNAGPWIVGIGFYTFGRPLVLGFFVGLVLGDPVTGTIVGCTIQLIFLGVLATGGSIPSDGALAGIIGTAAAITSGLSPEEAIAIAVPVGLAGSVLMSLRYMTAIPFAHLADKYAAEGNTHGVFIANVVLPQIVLACIYIIPCTLACYFGINAIQGMVDALAGSAILRIFGVIGGILPVIGIAMNMKAIYKGDARLFFYLGFLLVVYLDFNMVAISLFALIAAVLYVKLTGQNNAQLAFEEDDDDE